LVNWLPPPARWLRLKKRASSRGIFLLAVSMATGGEAPPEDIKENEFSLRHSFRLLSAYRTGAGDKLWVVTEGDRSSTCILLPEEY
jgi:hypothetical protein